MPFGTTPNPFPPGLGQTPVSDQAGKVTRSWLAWFQKLPRVGGLTLTQAQKLTVSAANYDDGTVLYVSNRGVFYVAIGAAWRYLAGIFEAPIALIPNDLGANDVGFLFSAEEFNHLQIWTGTEWTWAPGEAGSDYIVAFLTGPDPATGWQPCDGSVDVPKLNADGSQDFVTVPTIAGSYYRQ